MLEGGAAQIMDKAKKPRARQYELQYDEKSVILGYLLVQEGLTRQNIGKPTYYAPHSLNFKRIKDNPMKILSSVP